MSGRPKPHSGGDSVNTGVSESSISINQVDEDASYSVGLIRDSLNNYSDDDDERIQETSSLLRRHSLLESSSRSHQQGDNRRGRSDSGTKTAVPKAEKETRYGSRKELLQDRQSKFKGKLPPSQVVAIDRCSCCPSFCFKTVWGLHMHPLNLTLFILYISGAILFCIAVSSIMGQRWVILTSAHQTTSTSLQVKDARTLDFPAITICNLAAHVPLELLSCKSFDHQTVCPEWHVPHPPELYRYHHKKMKVNNDGHGDQQKHVKMHAMDHCLIFNNKPGDSYTTVKKGLADALVIVLKLNIAKYKEHAKFSGVHINLHPQCDRRKGECPDELSSSLLAAPGIPHFYRMSKHRHIHLNGTVQEYYDAKDSSSGDFKFEDSFGDRKDTVVMTFYYGSMSMTVVKELPRYTWFSMMGEVGGIMGLLFGVGVINVIGALLKSIILGTDWINHSCFV